MVRGMGEKNVMRASGLNQNGPENYQENNARFELKKDIR